MNKPLGGRGKKMAYTSKTFRIPEPLWTDVEKLVTSFHNSEKLSSENSLNLEEAIKVAEVILKSKKSARISLSKLLSEIYNTEVSL